MKSFEAYWKNAKGVYWSSLEMWQAALIKHACKLAYSAGLKAGKKL